MIWSIVFLVIGWMAGNTCGWFRGYKAGMNAKPLPSGKLNIEIRGSTIQDALELKPNGRH